VDLDAHEDPVQQLRVVGTDLDEGPRLVPVLAAQVQALDPVVASVLEDVVEHPGEDPGVHQMSGEGDGL
jgi:hypothetical protein